MIGAKVIHEPRVSSVVKLLTPSLKRIASSGSPISSAASAPTTSNSAPTSGSRPVSYTHLDVYKRQVEGLSLAPGDRVELETARAEVLPVPIDSLGRFDIADVPRGLVRLRVLAGGRDVTTDWVSL